MKNLLRSFLLSLLLLAAGMFTAADLPLKAVHCEPPFLCSRAEAAISMTFDEMYAGVSMPKGRRYRWLVLWRRRLRRPLTFLC